jgi:hypothetical protein
MSKEALTLSKRFITNNQAEMLPRTSRVVRKVVCSLSGNRRYSNRRIQLSSEVEWWKDDARLVQKTSDPSRPHIIFLEGPAGVAKRDVMWKLNNVRIEHMCKQKMPC